MFCYIVIAVLLTILLTGFQHFMRKKRILCGKAIPKHHGRPFLGMALDINETNSVYKFGELAERYGEIFSLNFLVQNVVVLNSERLMRKAFCSENYAKYFNDKPKSFYGKYFRADCASVAFESNARGPLYKQLKKTFMKALHTYGTGIQKLEDKVMIEMGNVLKKIDKMDPKEFEFVGFLRRSLSNIISVVLIGEMIPPGDPDEDLFWQKVEVGEFFVTHYVESVLSLFPALRFLPFTEFGQKNRFAMSLQERFIKKYFHSTQEHGKGEGIVNFYLEEQRKETETTGVKVLTDERIIAQIIETVEAGIATTWSAITNSMLILLNHPECQTKIQKEIDRVIGQGRLPTYTDRADCHYIMAFEKEVHRYVPVLPLLLPHICNEDIVFEGYNITKNSLIVANTWFVSHDEKIWGDPWNFRPERFLDENGNILPSEHLYCRSIMPFGLGQRQCAGN